ncbi:response regulator transcription factor [Flagellimonas marinaquae]|uniref:response regulator transcription factor n=1 Tax=Flagellimonas marinaquae TaxID=254955 RepID=UPI000F8F06BE|nr:response regulator transcription factor [Allomuricauda aquimarina]
MKKTIFIFSALIISLLVLFKLSNYFYLSGDISAEIVIALIAIAFFGIGIFINKKSLHKERPSFVDQKKIKKLGISNREYEVLVHISKGLSNKEIASTLFVSESTIKTHVSNLLIKLDAKRRTQAVQKAKNLHILPV